MRSTDGKRRQPRAGFTLIEVTLAIVIGIVMVASATLIYNQAKASAGNSRAQTKVAALRTLVEEYMTMNSGVPPANLADVDALWQRKRPDDWNKSPWGGVLGSGYLTGGANGAGTGVASQTGASVMVLAYAPTTPAGRPPDGVAASTTANSALGGGLVYDIDPANGTWTYQTDLTTNGPMSVQGYAVYICDQQGTYPNFVTGPRPNQ